MAPATGPRSSSLPDIFVQPISDRSGQELRLALQQRLAGTSDAAPQGYTLAVSYSIAGEAVGINGDNSAERSRLVGRAHWVLAPVSPAAAPVTSGDARVVDGFNIINEQYFASNLATETTQQRLANNLADIVATQLATWFNNHRPPASAPAARRGGTDAGSGQRSGRLRPVAADRPRRGRASAQRDRARPARSRRA